MGYYQGDGLTSSGGENTRTLKSFYEWGAFAIRQKSVYSTNTKPGVSLTTARNTHATDNLTAVSGGSGTLAWIIYDAEGTKKAVNYMQISGSNLYELNVMTETLNAWQSSTTTRIIN